MLSKEIAKKFHKAYKRLFIHNLQLNGSKAALYCFGLSASRYIEYSSALYFLCPERRVDNMIVIEIGCGHSILPTSWAERGLQVIAVDISRDALTWQETKSREMLNGSFHSVLADAKNLPFRAQAISVVSCISAIEHICNDGDVQAAYEMGRVLKPNGLCLVSLPLSSHMDSYSKTDWTAEIPPLLKRVFKPFLPVIFDKFKVDRTLSHFERFYSLEDVEKRIVVPSCCIKEDFLALKSRWMIKFLYEKMVPTGVLTPLEFLMARLLTISKSAGNTDAIILKLRKPSH